ncbi:MAG: hypothetical protein AAF480_19330, partial [Actinomycetota bacterium]
MGKNSRKKRERREQRAQQAQKGKPKVVAKEESKPEKKGRKGNPLLRFVVLFLVLIGIFHVIYYEWIIGSALFDAYLMHSARIAGVLLKLSGLDVNTFQDTLSARGFSISIKVGCDGLRPMAILVFAVLTFPVKGRLKWPGLGWGLGLLLILNILRIASLLWIGLKSRET